MLYGKKIAIFAAVNLMVFAADLKSEIQLFVSDEQKNETTLNESELYARSAILMDASSGRILFDKNGEEKLPMASTTKVMTCILALEYGNIEDIVTVSSYASSMPKVHLGVKPGECYMLNDLLYSLMLESHNDSAVVIAEHIGGTVENFAKMMNQKARDIGCYDSYFITPNGLDASAVIQTSNGKTEIREHSTTASDLAKILSYCVLRSPKCEEFLEITRKACWNFSNIQKSSNDTWITGERTFSCTNHNALLTMMDGVLSGKTGFTGNAGYCYTGILENGGRYYTVALLACGWPNNKQYKWEDTKKLMNYGMSQYEYREFSRQPLREVMQKQITAENGQTESIGEQAIVPIYIEETENEDGQKIDGLLLKKMETVEVSCQLADQLEAPIAYGEPVGSIRYALDGIVWKTVYLKSGETIKRIDYAWCITKIFNSFLTCT